MENISVPATVRGTADPANHDPIEFREKKTGQITTAAAGSRDGEFSIRLPEGYYDVRQGSVHTSVTILPSGSYNVDLRPDRVLDFKVMSQDLGNNELVLRVSAEGAGHHAFTIRSENLTLKEAGRLEMNLTSAGAREIVWHAHVVSPTTPWVAVVIPDGTLSERREVRDVISGPLSDTARGRSKTR